MATTHRAAAIITAGLLLTGAAVAQPRIVQLGGGVANRVLADGSKVAGSFSAGPVLTIGATVSGASTPGFDFVAASADMAYLGGYSSGPARWNTSTGTVQHIALAAGLSSATVRAISADGRYLCGLGYLSANGPFRPWVWDANAAGGAGQMFVLPTNNGNGQAYLVGNDGTVAGIDDCCGSANRPAVWRFNAGLNSWVESYLPFDSATSGAAYSGGSTDAMNQAGTVIVGSINVGGSSIQMARWIWNAADQTWSRITIPISAMPQPSWLSPTYNATNLFATSVTDDGELVGGITVYTFFSDFQRGGFLWRPSLGTIVDLYDTMVGLNAPNIARYGPAFGTGSPPALGFPVAMSPDGTHIATYAGPQTGFGPPTLISLNGGPCVQPTATAVNSTTSVPSGNSAFLNCSVTGSEPLSVQWRFNGAPIMDGPSGTGSTYYGATGHGTIGVQLLISGTTVADSGSYDCVVTNPCGSAARPPLTLIVNAGACCYSSPSGGAQCTVEGSSHCSGSLAVGGLGGVYLGDNTVCTPSSCDAVIGACCYGPGGADAACVIDLAGHCALAISGGGNGGTYLGNQTTCAPQACAAATGACCYSTSSVSDVVCTAEVSSRCTASVASGNLGGSFIGNGTACSPTACSTVAGGCCYSPNSTTNVICTIQTQTHCTGTLTNGHLAGIYVGAGTTCSPADLCSIVSGACCYSLDNTSNAICTIQLLDRCTRAANNSGLGGTYRGDGTTCTPTICASVTGACCYSDFSTPGTLLCTIQPAARCAARFYAGGLFGYYLGGGTTCSPDPCGPVTGACCYIPFGDQCYVCSLEPKDASGAGSARCTEVNNGGLGGTWAGAGAVCGPTTCNLQIGACCVQGSCTQICHAICDANSGAYQGDNTTCSPDPCAPPAGACCCGSHCSVTAAAACSGANTRFAGAGSSCTPYSSVAPCCRGDYNKNASGAPVSVQDIFDFLTGYFSNDACADSNDSGLVSVQDIFDFLSSYFGGC